MELHLLQKDVAPTLCISEDSLTNWENNLTEPEIRYFPAIIQFLSYNPFYTNKATFSGKIKYYRQIKGLTHTQMGKLLGVDASTIGSWEKDEHRPNRKHLTQIERNLIKLIG